MKNVVITIPAYNEERTIDRVIKGIKLVMDKTNYKYKILVVDDGSKDRTRVSAESEGAIVISHLRNMGLAKTFETEMQECLKLNADIIVHTDADGQYPSYFIPQLLNKIEEGYDLVLGSRFGQGQYSGSLMKRCGNKLFAKVFSRLLKMKIKDTTTGFRAFTQEVARLPLINSFTYTQEQLIRAGKSNMKIGEVPIKTRATRESKLFKNPLDYAIKAWVNIFRIYRDFEPLKFFGRGGILFIFVSFLIGSYLSLQYFLSGFANNWWDTRVPSLILLALFFIGGVQLIFFGFLADMLKK